MSNRVFATSVYGVLLATTMAVTPALAVNNGDNGGPNYAGVQWRFAVNPGTTQCPLGVCGGDSASPSYTIWATVRKNGQVVCNDSVNFSVDVRAWNGKAYSLCGQPAIIDGDVDRICGDMRAYYQVDNGPSGWVDSPSHDVGPGCDHFWQANW